MRESVAALRKESHTCSTDNAVWLCNIGIGISAGRRSGTSPSRLITSVEPSATLTGRLAYDPAKRTAAKTRTSRIRPQNKTPSTSPIRKFFIGTFILPFHVQPHAVSPEPSRAQRERSPAGSLEAAIRSPCASTTYRISANTLSNTNAACCHGEPIACVPVHPTPVRSNGGWRRISDRSSLARGERQPVLLNEHDSSGHAHPATSNRRLSNV